MGSQLKTFLTLSPKDNWEYPQVDLGEGQRALDIQSKIRSKLDQLKVPGHIFAHCIINGHSRVFQSPLNGVKAVDEFDNADALRLLGAQTMDNLRESLKSNPGWLKWFNAIFENVSLYSDGTEVVFVWGLELTEKEKFEPSKTELGPKDTTPNSQLAHGHVSQTQENDTSASGESEEKDEYEETDELEETEIESEVRRVPTPPASGSWLKWLLWLLIVLLFLLWLWLLSWCNRPCQSADLGYINGVEVVNPLPDRLPENPNVAMPWNPEDVAQDSTSGQLFFADRWNIAYTEKDRTFDQFVTSVDSLIPPEEGNIIYWDPLIGRVQCEWLVDRPFPAAELRRQLSDYQGLLWPERLMSNGAAILNVDPTDTEPTWHLEAIGWERFDPNLEKGVGIAVVDDGFDLRGSGLNQITKFPLNVASRQHKVSASEFRSHGTHVASLAAAPERSETAFQGVSASSTLIPVQIHSDDVPLLPMSNIVDGILYATRKGATVVNLSLGMDLPKSWGEMSRDEKKFFLEEFRNMTLDERRFWRHLFESLEKEGVVVVIAAGNDGAPLELDPMHESVYPVYVTATEFGGGLASFSNVRSEGNDSLTVVAAPGRQVHSWIPGNTLAPMNGTSMAAPIVAGVIAEMMAQQGVLSPRAVREKFQRLPESSPHAGVKLWIPALIHHSTNL